jgi:hypothetical protein
MVKKVKAFTISKALRNKLPEKERADAEKTLLDKAKGLCALCSRPLGTDSDLITADHRIAGGKNTLSNLYLAHRSCNSSRGDIDFDRARPLVEFKVFSEEIGAVTFDQVIERYIHHGKKQISFSEKGDVLTISLASKKTSLPLYTDPATGNKYCFGEIPVEYVLNDREVQPRLIIYPHVRRLALDFYERPVHEPSNCRLVTIKNDVAELRQFDGQHKTTAQVLMGRTSVPMKIYLNPEIAMLQALVVKIQQEIKKQPLTRSDTLAKLGDVFKSLLDSYVEKHGLRTEKGFVEAQPKDKRTDVRKLYFNELARIAYFDEDNELRDWVKPGATHAPTTDKVVIDKMIKPLIHNNLLEVDMDAEGGRDTERKLIVLILNTIARKMPPPDWFKDANKFQRTRTQNFFYQGSIGWWMQDILIPTLRYILYRIKKDTPLLVESVTADKEGQIIEAVETLCDWPIWTTDDPNHLKAMRSNTIKNVADSFKEYRDQTLIEEVLG